MKREEPSAQVPARDKQVDVDIKGFFDAIPHDRLMALVREHVADGRVLGLIEVFLRKGWYGYFKHVHPSELDEIDQWLRMRLRSILRKRRGGRGRGQGQDHHRWPNRYFTGHGRFCQLEAKATEIASLQ
jgi:hypothetical protein